MSERIILLRSPRADDPYVTLLEDGDFEVSCVPVLAFRFPADDTLSEHLSEHESFAGLIVTSPRAVDALGRIEERRAAALMFWKSKPTYVVGPRTGEKARELGLKVEGESSGRATELAGMIRASERPLLFLAGSRRRDELPHQLRSREIEFKELCVYETHIRTDVPSSELEADWIVFFSPSGIEAVEGKVAGGSRLAAIGPTTAEALRDRDYSVRAVADSPTPEGLLRALQKHRTIG